MDNREKVLDYSKKYHEENKDRVNARHRVSDKEWYKKNADYKKNYRTERYANDEEAKRKDREYARQYYRENIEQEKASDKRYKRENKDKIRKYYNQRYENDPLYNLKARLRARTLTAFKRKGWKKNTRTQETLKGTWEEVKEHI